MFNSGNCASVPLVANIDGCNSGSGYGNGMWGENGLLFIIVLALLFGWGNNGWGNNGVSGNTGSAPYVINANTGIDNEIQRGFNQQAVISKLDGITQGICDGFYATNASIMNAQSGIQNSLCQGFNGVNTAMLQGFNGVERGFCNVSAQLADCCCQNREAIAQVRYDMATQACDTRNTIQNTTRDIIDNNNANTRSILDFLVQDKISSLQAENQSLKFAASQSEQNAFIAANQNAQTAELIRRLGADCPTPAYVVQPPQPVTFPNFCNSGCGCA